MPLHEELRAEAYSLGFSLAGVTDLQPTAHLQQFRRWVQNGLHAGMAYLNRPDTLRKRANPALVFPQGRAVICLAYPYPHPGDFSITPGKGRLASYAWGEDYHLIIPPLLEQLALSLSRMSGRQVQFLACTDSSPLMERDLAQRAGLGWIGRNTCLIHPRLGSFFFLAELIVDTEIEPDAPFSADYCGTCRRCIDACPTGCILPDRSLDARRCLSYLSIENKGAIPSELRAKMADWVFGCDICQQVCPWNQHSTAPSSASTAVSVDLAQHLLLTAPEFSSRFHRSPILRARREGYLRNLAVVMGNQALPAFIPALTRVLEDETSPLVRAHAAWALRQVRTPEAEQVARRMRAVESDPAVRAELEG